MLTTLTRTIPSSWTGARKQCGANRRRRPGRAASLPVAAVAETAVETAVEEPARAAWPAQQSSFRGRGCAVEVSSGPNGRGLFAKRDVAPGREALSVPLHACLLVIDDPSQPEGLNPPMFDMTWHPNDPSPRPPIADLYPGARYLEDWQAHFGTLPQALVACLTSPELDAAARLCLWLLWLRHQQQEGRLHQYWAEYLEGLRAEHELTCLAMFDAQEAQELQVPHYLEAAAAARSTAEATYATLFGSSSGCKPHPLVAALCAEQQLPVVGLSDFLWAYGCVSSREFGVGPYRMLVPFADMANHSFQENAAWQLMPLTTPTPTYSFTTTRKLNRGTELLLCYGAHRNNTQLLASYGFVLPGNLADRVLGLSSQPSEASAGRFAASNAFADRLDQEMLGQQGTEGDGVWGRGKLNAATFLVSAGFAVKDEAPHYGIHPGVARADGFLTDVSEAAITWRRKLAAVLSLPLDLAQLQQGVFRQAIKQRHNPLRCLQLQTHPAPTNRHYRRAAEGATVTAGAAAAADTATVPGVDVVTAELQLVEQLLWECEQGLAAMPTGLDQDLQVLQQPGLEPRAWAAVAARAEYKQLLGSAVELLEGYRQQLQDV